jgi:hypothetical protein
LEKTLLLYGKSLEEHRVTARKGAGMKKQKDLNACISLLRDLQARGGVNPEKTEVVGYAVDELETIRRKPNLKRHELHKSVRRLVDKLLQAFTNRD